MPVLSESLALNYRNENVKKECMEEAVEREGEVKDRKEHWLGTSGTFVV